METIGERVRGLIAQSEISQGDFAGRVGLDNSKLSKSLSGARRFSSLDLAKIAEFGGVSVDWLLSGGPRAAVALAARAKAGSNTRRALAEAARLSNVRSDIALLGYAQPWRGLPEVVPRGLLVEQGKSLARLARQRFAAGGVDPSRDDLATAIERTFGVDVAIGDLGPRFDGLCVNSDEVKLILVAQSGLPWRQRFTMAHELGHLLANDDQGIHLDDDILAAGRSRDRSEMRAGAFAADLLMPEDALRAAAGTTGLDRDGFASLACSLRVSPGALAYRLLNLRLIDAGRCGRFRAESAQSVASAAGLNDVFSAESAVAKMGRPPGLLVRDTYDAYRSGRASLRPYANVLAVDVDELYEQLASTVDVGDDQA